MEDTVWFDDPMNLFTGNKLLKFWPLASQTPEERVNATTRFIIYISIALFIIKKDIRIFVLASVAIGILYAFYKSEMITTATRPAQADGRKNPGFMRPAVQRPSYDNPMANVLFSDYTEHPDRPGAAFYPEVRGEVRKYLDDTFPQDVADVYGHRNQAASRFYSMPVTTIPGDQTGFAEACYGKKFRPVCRDDQSACTAEGNTRQPEQVQLRAMTGALSPTYFPSV